MCEDIAELLNAIHPRCPLSTHLITPNRYPFVSFAPRRHSCLGPNVLVFKLHIKPRAVFILHPPRLTAMDLKPDYFRILLSSLYKCCNFYGFSATSTISSPNKSIWSTSSSLGKPSVVVMFRSTFSIAPVKAFDEQKSPCSTPLPTVILIGSSNRLVSWKPCQRIFNRSYIQGINPLVRNAALRFTESKAFLKSAESRHSEILYSLPLHTVQSTVLRRKCGKQWKVAFWRLPVLWIFVKHNICY